MQAKSSLRALLRTTTQLRSICSTSIAAGTRTSDQFRPFNRKNDESGRPDFTRRAGGGEREDSRRIFKPRKEDGGRPRGHRNEGETYKGDFESRLERNIERISSRPHERERERPESSANPRRGGYQGQQSTGRPGYRVERGGREGGGGGGNRTGPRAQGYTAREPVDRSRHIPGKASFGLKKRVPIYDPSTSNPEKGVPAAGSISMSSETASKIEFPRRDRDRDRRPEVTRQTVPSTLTHHSRPDRPRDKPDTPRPQTNGQSSNEPQSQSQAQAQSQMPWRPAKKLTYQAMAGLRALHANDPKTFDKDALSQRFGISYEAVTRILRSKYQDRQAGAMGESIQGTKWDLDARSSVDSPVPAVQRAFARRNSLSGKTEPDTGKEQ